MSCRSNAGNSTATSYARFNSGLNDVQTLSLFHALVREGATQNAPDPTSQQISDWANQFSTQVRADPNLSETQRQSLIGRAERVSQLPTPPNGATFYAWQNMQGRAVQTRMALDSAYDNIARNLGISPEEARQQARQLQNAALNSSRQLRPSEEFVRRSQDTSFLANVPQDRATLYALDQLNQQALQRRERQQEQSQDQADQRPNRTASASVLETATSGADDGLTPQPPPPPPTRWPFDLQRVPISSSYIAAIGYDEGNSQLQVEFSNGSIYSYGGVSQSTYLQLAGGSSVGQFYRDAIRGQYPSNRVVGPDGARAAVTDSVQVQTATALVTGSLTQERLASQAAQERSRRPRRSRTTSVAAQSGSEAAPSRVVTEAEAIAREAFAAASEQSMWAEYPAPFSRDMISFQAAYEQAKARKARGEAPVPYLTQNATGGLGSREGGRGFGVELEFDLTNVPDRYSALQAIGRELNTAGITRSPYQQEYHSGSDDYRQWRFERDRTVDGEIISPIMYDEPERWEELAKVCEIVRRHGGKATARTGGHVHVAAGNYDHTPKNHNNLLKMFKQNEDVIYRMAQNPDRNQHRGTTWCQPNNLPTSDYESIEQVNRQNNSHHIGLNFQSVQGRDSDHVEFRMWDGSLDPGVIQSQIKMSLGMTEAAFRATAQETASVSTEPIGSHHTRNRNGTSNGRARRLTGHEWVEDSKGFRQLVDQLFSRNEDKEQATALFAVTKWQKTRH